MWSRLSLTSKLLCAAVACMTVACSSLCWSQVQVSYRLLEGSTITEDCTICDRIPITLPLRGTMVLSLREMNPLMTTYDVTDVQFRSDDVSQMFDVTGEGTYTIGGEVAIVHEMHLDVEINSQSTIGLDADFSMPDRTFPIIDISPAQKETSTLLLYSLHLIAAPVREIWFSTEIPFTPGTLKQGVGAGAMLSDGGRVVLTNQDLVGALGAMPVVPELGLDAVDVGSQGEVFFSTEDGIFSETLGYIQHGDLLSNRGRIVFSNQQLTSAFTPMPMVPDVGLDALQVMEDGTVVFSIEEDLFSGKLGATLRHGDLLSNKGVVMRSGEDLLARFDRVDAKTDVGLDAVYVWPHGEIWFSTDEGFESRTLGHISDGDLLSDAGSIVYRNLELMRQFAPLEKIGNFGLDSLFLVVEGEVAETSVSKITFSPEKASGNLLIEWVAKGRVFQVERADDPGGPYVPVGDILPATGFLDPASILERTKGFYRIREW